MDLAKVWEVIPSITSGVALAAFVATVIAFVVANRTKRKHELLKTVPAADRLEAIRELADDLGISAKGLRDEEKIFQLVMARMVHKSAAQRSMCWLIFGVALLATAVAGVQILQDAENKQQPKKKIEEPAASPTAREARISADESGRQPIRQPAPQPTPQAKGQPRLAQTEPVRGQAAGTAPKPRNDPAAGGQRTMRPVAGEPQVAHYGEAGEAVAALGTQGLVPALLGMRVKVVYSGDSAPTVTKMGKLLKDAGAFVDEERWLPEQMQPSSSIRYSHQRLQQAQATQDVLRPEFGAIGLQLLSNVQRHDLEIHVGNAYPAGRPQ